MQQIIDGGRIINSRISHSFLLVDGTSGAGFSFDCTPDGEYIITNPAAQENLDWCLSNPDKVIDEGISEHRWVVGYLCSCGSGKERYPLYDARGIFVNNVCDQCVKKVKSRYAPWVWDGYDQSFLDDPIEEEG